MRIEDSNDSCQMNHLASLGSLCGGVPLSVGAGVETVEASMSKEEGLSSISGSAAMAWTELGESSKDTHTCGR